MQAVFQQQQPQLQAQQVVAAQPAKPKRGTRKAWTPERFSDYVRHVAHSAKLIGQSYTHPLQPAKVPEDAPDTCEWNALSTKISNLVPAYSELYDAKKKLGKTGEVKPKTPQYVYIDAAMTAFYNNSGVLGPHKIPTDVLSPNLGIFPRTLLTSLMVAFSESRKLKHPQKGKYIWRNEELKAIITDAHLELLKAPKDPKKPKKTKKPKNPARQTLPKEEQPRVKLMERDGEMKEHFNFDTIPIINGHHILPIAPRHVTDQQKFQIETIRTYLKGLTLQREEARDALREQQKNMKKNVEIQKGIVPTSVRILNMDNALQLQPQGQVPVPQQQQPQLQPYQVVPPGYNPVPGVTFTN